MTVVRLVGSLFTMLGMLVPAWTVGAAAAPQAARLPFYENRDDPRGLLRSYYNAINRREYRRAYRYWEQGATGISANDQTYRQFVNGYSDTRSVRLLTGRETGGGAAGSVYVAIPTVLIVTRTDGTIHRFSGCYVMRRRNMGLGGAQPENRYWHIYKGIIHVARAGASDSSLLQHGCPF
ncbi:MAG: hypothetical protein NVS4B8_28000 [Herpetosiphon sp.]